MKLVLANAPVSGFQRGIADWKKGRRSPNNPYAHNGDMSADEIALAAGWDAGNFTANVMNHRGVEF